MGKVPAAAGVEWAGGTAESGAEECPGGDLGGGGAVLRVVGVGGEWGVTGRYPHPGPL